MAKYLGETLVDQNDTPFKEYGTNEWTMYFIERYGQIDGGHHKAWVLDQVARIQNGTNVVISLAKWDDGHEEYRVWLAEPSSKYLTWVEEMKDWDEDEEEYQYGYDEGIAP